MGPYSLSEKGGFNDFEICRAEEPTLSPETTITGSGKVT